MLNRHFSSSIFDMFFTPQCAFAGQACQSKAEKYFHLRRQDVHCPSHPIFELQAKMWRNLLHTDDDDGDWSLGGTKAGIPIGEAEFLQKPDESSHRCRIKCGCGTRLVLKPGTSPAVPVWNRGKHLRAYFCAWRRASMQKKNRLC